MERTARRSIYIYIKSKEHLFSYSLCSKIVRTIKVGNRKTTKLPSRKVAPPPLLGQQHKEGGVSGQPSPPSQAGHTPDPGWAPRDTSDCFSLLLRWFFGSLISPSSRLKDRLGWEWREAKTLRNKHEAVSYSLIPGAGNQRVRSTFSLIRSAARLSEQ